MKKLSIILGIIVVLIILIGGIVVFILGLDFEAEMENTTSDKDQVIEELKEKIKELEEQGCISSGTCTYIQTYKYLGEIEYDNGLGSRFILVDKFQMFTPFILEIPSDYDMEYGNYYEFTILEERNKNNTKKTVTDITFTDKEGLSQIQENCVVN